jgi:Cu(I)/Ag(I) efflux system membrane fusion protein
MRAVRSAKAFALHRRPRKHEDTKTRRGEHSKVFAVVLALATIGCGVSGFVGEIGCGSASLQKSSAGPAAGSELPSTIVDPYLKIQTALAQDRMNDVKAGAASLAAAASAIGAPAQAIDTAAGRLAASTEVGDARQKFGTLSDAVVAYMTSEHLTLPSGVRKAWCPMAQKPWLQKGDTIANPYYGTSMPTCGTFQ